MATYRPNQPLTTPLDGAQLGGICVDIWNRITKELNLTYSITEIYDWDHWPSAIGRGGGDIGIQSLLWTEERNEAFDYTPPFQVRRKLCSTIT